jgi:hypothetical protein
MKYGNLNFLETAGSLQARNGPALLFTYPTAVPFTAVTVSFKKYFLSTSLFAVSAFARTTTV